jgi:integrase
MVPSLTWTQLRKWRDGLIRTSAKKRKTTSEPMSIDSIKPQPTAAQKLSPATINRTCAAFKAALNHVANGSDQHVVNSLAWEKGLELIPDAQQARNVILPDAAVLQIAAKAYTPEAEFGLFVEVAAVTGARPGQIRRLTVADLQADHTSPRLMMPSSRKGKNGLTKASHHPVPITADLSKRLQDGAAGRPPTAPLLTKPDGGPWKKSDQGRRFDHVVKQCGLANWKQPGYPEKITIYALRHSDIVHQIRANVPLRIIAATHDTSVAMIERHYSRYIADHTDAISRAALLDMSKPITEHQIGSR